MIVITVLISAGCWKILEVPIDDLGNDESKKAPTTGIDAFC